MDLSAFEILMINEFLSEVYKLTKKTKKKKEGRVVKRLQCAVCNICTNYFKVIFKGIETHCQFYLKIQTCINLGMYNTRSIGNIDKNVSYVAINMASENC